MRYTQPVRKLLKRREVGGDVRFITFSCHRRLQLFGSPAIRDVFRDSLAQARAARSFELFAWVVMPEHVHLLLRPRAGTTVSALLRSVKTAVAKRVLARWVELDAPVLSRLRTPRGALRFWQKGGGFDRNERDEAEFCREVRYIHQNTVERKLVRAAQDWAWSSARWWLGVGGGTLDCDPPPGDPRRWEKRSRLV